MKILVIRFSSIGDIVLTSPVLRGIKEQVQGAEVHFATKQKFASVVENNPYLSKLHFLEGDFRAFKNQLKAERFDLIIDLHHNLRSLRLKKALGVKSYSFDKINFKKWMSVRFKNKKYLPPVHIVDRYLETVKKLGVVYDGKGLDYFLGNETLPKEFEKTIQSPFIAVAIGGQHFTKRMPPMKLAKLLQKSSLPLVLLGGKEDEKNAEEIVSILPNQSIFNLCGKLSLNQSALVVKHAQKLITHDTGLMHMGAAFKIPIISIWGNTLPEFGMTPYFPKDSQVEKQSFILEVQNLACRPCSKIGFDKCPKGHFNCMNKIEYNHVEL